jgi:hypothetical protein
LPNQFQQVHQAGPAATEQWPAVHGSIGSPGRPVLTGY